MTKLISGRVAKVPSANVSADRYEFLDLSETEPDLGLPPVSGYVLAANTNGTRFWTNPAGSGLAQFAYTAGSANVSLLANVANAVLTISNFTTANLVEGINLYYSNARVIDAVTPLLTTGNVVETTNQYFTNARVTGALVQSNVYVQNLIANDTLFANALILQNINVTSNIISGTVVTSTTTSNTIVADSVTSNTWNRLYTANVIETSGNLYFTAERVNATVQPFLTTANVAELTNLYFTNARVIPAVTPLLTTSNVAELTNLYFTNVRVLQAVNPVLTTSNVAELTNLYFTNARVIPAVTPLLTTANVIESTNNLYYTNSRVRSALSNSTGVYYNSSTGAFSIGQDVSQSADVIFKDLTVNGNLFLLGNLVSVFANTLTIADPIIQLGYGNPGDAYDLGWVGHYSTGGTERHAGFFRDRTDGKFKIFDNLTTEPGLTEIDTGNVTFRYASIVASTFEGNVTGFVTGQVSSLDNFDTNALKEGSNLYFTNARVVSALIAGQNIIIEANGRISANITTTLANLQSQITNLSTDQISEGSVNLYYTNSRVISAITPRLTTANVIETSGNLYFTNSRVVSALTAGQNITIEANGRISANVGLSIANLQSQISGLTTDQIGESNTNRYFTNTRAVIAVTPFLTTANVIETAGNLYFTNTRVLVGITTGTVVGNITATGTVTANILSANTLSIGSGAGGTITGFANVIATDTVTANIIRANTLAFGESGGAITGIANITATDTITANIIRANTIILQNINVTSNIITGTVSSGTTTSNIILADSVTSNTWNRLYTSNVVENTNQFFTNARVLVGVTTGTVVGNITATDTITANILSANILSIGSGAGGTITGFANVIATDTITANIIRANIIILQNINVTSNIITGTVSSGTTTSNVILADSVTSNTWNRLYTSNVIENTNQFFTNARVLVGVTTGTVVGNITATGTVTANIISANVGIFGSGSGGSLLGANIISAETISANLLLTNVLIANAAILGAGTGGSLTGANLLSTITIQANSWLGLYTANVIESPTNLFFTNSRVLTGITTGVVLGNIVASGDIVAYGNLIANVLIIRNIAVSDAVLTGNVSASGFAGNTITVNIVTANIWNGLYTANVIESPPNLFFTNARVIAGLVNSNVQVENLYANSTVYANALIIQSVNVTSTVLAGNITSGTSTSNVVLADSVTSNTWNRLYTANVIETAGNLYFTNTRVVSALSSGQNIIIASNGQISANVISISPGDGVTLEANGRLSVTLIPVTTINDSSRIVSTGNLTYDIQTAISDPKNILVIVEGMVQIPYTDYSTSGTVLTFTDAPAIDSNIEIRFFGVDTINSSRAIAASVDSFIGDGTNVSYTLSTVPPNKNFVSIIIDGVYQHSDVFTLNNKTITFPESPAPGSNIDIRVIGGTAGSSYNTRTFTGNGISNTFTLSEGFTRDTILVFENGVAQMPLTDYDIVNNDLVFTTAPASNVTVQVRELGISGLSGSNVVAAIRGADQIVGNLIPTTDINKNLGSINRKFNKLYLEANGLVVGSTTLSTVGATLSITYSGTTTQVATAVSRTTVSGTTANLANAATANLSITGYKGYLLYKIQTSTNAWVRIYTDTASRTADAGRDELTDPTPGSGVIAEVITSGAQTILISPGAIGFNNEASPTTDIPIAVTNKSNNTAAITVTLTIVQTET